MTFDQILAKIDDFVWGVTVGIPLLKCWNSNLRP